MNLLEIQSSVRQDGSVSRILASKFIFQWRTHQPEAQHHLRDVGGQSPALITGDWVVANLTPPPQQTEATQALLAESDALIAELFAADRLVLGVPMYNFGIPANLKAYFDNVIRVGRTVEYDPETGAFTGLLTGKKALIISSRAGSYGPNTPAAAIDFCASYLRFILNYLGVADVTYVEVPHQGGDAALRQQATEGAIAQLMELAQNW